MEFVLINLMGSILSYKGVINLQDEETLQTYMFMANVQNREIIEALVTELVEDPDLGPLLAPVENKTEKRVQKEILSRFEHIIERDTKKLEASQK